MKIIGIIVCCFIAAYSLFHWFRVKLWVPKYIHFLAVIMLLVGVNLNHLGQNLKHSSSSFGLFMVFGFPLAVYIIYGLYGGWLVSTFISINKYMTIDRGMIKEEAISLLTEQLNPYKKWRFENLLLLSKNNHVSDLTGKSGKKYKFVLIADKEIEENKITVTGILIDIGQRFYKPKSVASFQISDNGVIKKDGLTNA